MSAVVVLVMVVVLLAFALGVVMVVAMVLRKETDKVRAARGEPSVVESEPVGKPDSVVEPVETTETEDTQPVPIVDKHD